MRPHRIENMGLELSYEDLNEQADMRSQLSSRQKHCAFKGQNDRCVAYQLFRRRIIHRNRPGAPAASTPLPTGGQHNTNFMLDSVRQRLLLDSPPRHQPETAEVEPEAQQSQERCAKLTQQQSRHHVLPLWKDLTQTMQQSRMTLWRAVKQDHANTNQESTSDLQPFTESENELGHSQMKLSAPSLLDDYYTNVLDCSCNGVIALALGSSVFLWNSETHTLVGSLAPKPGQGSPHAQSILSLCWSSDGRVLSVGNRRGDIELWDVEQKSNMRCLQSHPSAVRALSWKQNLLSSGSDLGHIHHYDLRASSALSGATVQQGGVCSLQWSQDDQLASGSTEGFLHVWDSDITRGEPVSTMRQPTSVKAMGWCPWQKSTIATGGGWKDGELRIWDTNSETSVTSVQTNSQICCLAWAGRTRRLVMGHGVPHHHITSWVWDSPALSLSCQFSGHSKRILHLALKSDDSQIFTAGADQFFQIWHM